MASRIGPSSRSTMSVSEATASASRRRGLGVLGEGRDPAGEVVGHQAAPAVASERMCSRIRPSSGSPGRAGWPGWPGHRATGPTPAGRPRGPRWSRPGCCRRATGTRRAAALGPAQPVAGVLVHLERDLVDELARRGLRLALPIGLLPLALHLESLRPTTAPSSAAGGMISSVCGGPRSTP